MSGAQYTITAGEHEATVVEVGAGLRRYTHRGAEITCGYGEDAITPKACGATLVPWPNRLRGGRYTFDGQQLQSALTEPAAGNAIHGLGRWARWTPVRHEASTVTLGLDIVPQTGWPFCVRVEVGYTLYPDHGLAVTASATNTGSRRAPFGAGFHPYLSTRGRPIDDVRLQVPAAKRLIVDDAAVPVGVQPVDGSPYDLRSAHKLGKLRMDTGFTGLSTTGGRGAAELRTRGGGAQLWFDETYRYLQVFTQDSLVDGKAAIAIEPMTCAPDAFNSGDGLIVLDPGGTWTGSWGITPLG